MSEKIRKQDALDYHEKDRPGKIEVRPTKATKSQRDLALAYSPGVAIPCLEIKRDVKLVNRYTSKANLVAVITNGTAVLGLGDIGPEAAKPVMEGKGVLFKVFAGIDVFDIELDAKDPEVFIQTVKAMAPTFGGINLEDISSPDCFEIEERLRNELNIPIMHDDQHGTAIISAAALLSALELVKKKIGKIKIVVSGAGASAISCAKLYVSLGAKKENIIMLDSKGVIHANRDNLDKIKSQFATEKKVDTLAEAMKGSDVFLGLSKGGILTAPMIKTMAKNPIIFALANPDPEINYDLAKKTRPDAIVATGRSDFPNQVNNVLGFPFIFRGALDVQATEINEQMKLAAVKALAELTKSIVPEIVNIAYNEMNIVFGKDYIIPKPVDPRLLTTVAPAVAKAAMDSGVAQEPIKDWEAYELSLGDRMGIEDHLIRIMVNRAKQDPKTVVFAEADNYKILKAVQIVLDQGIAKPVLLGDPKKINSLIKEFNLDLGDTPIIDSRSAKQEETRKIFGEMFFEKRKRRGYNQYEASKVMRDRNYYGAMMVETGQADALISGLTRNYPDTIKPALEIIGTAEGVKKVAGMYIMLTSREPLFFADTTVNHDPSVEDLVEIGSLTAEAVKKFNIKPRMALLSYSNFGSSPGKEPRKVRDATKLLQEKFDDILIDGELQANMALNQNLLKDNYPFSELIKQGANTLIFPNLSAGNIAYKLLQEMGTAEAVGPVLLGLKKPVHILQLGSSVREIVNMVTIAVIDAQGKSKK